MSRLRRLIREIHRRSLWQVLAIYLVGSWVGYQIVVALVSGLGLPDWFPAFAIVLFIAGLPIVLATAFVQEGAPVVGRYDPTLFGRPEAAPPARKARGLRRLFTWRNAIMGGLCAAALWGVIAPAWLLVGGREGREAAVAGLGPGRVLESEDLPSIAVLPFLNMSADPANEYFSDGVTEEIITDLSKLKILRVVSRSATFRYKGKELDPRDVGRELGVNAILEGSVRKEGDRLRITAQLINVADGFHVWSDDYDRRYEEALARDPNYALALAGLSLCQSQYINRGWSDDETWLEKAEASARKALEIDPDLAEAHFALGFVYEQRRMYDEEEAEMRVALALNPNHAHAHDSLADVYKFRGLLDEALAEYAIALRLDPFLAPSLCSFTRKVLSESSEKRSPRSRNPPNEPSGRNP